MSVDDLRKRYRIVFDDGVAAGETARFAANTFEATWVCKVPIEPGQHVWLTLSKVPDEAAAVVNWLAGGRPQIVFPKFNSWGPI